MRSFFHCHIYTLLKIIIVHHVKDYNRPLMFYLISFATFFLLQQSHYPKHNIYMFILISWCLSCMCVLTVSDDDVFFPFFSSRRCKLCYPLGAFIYAHKHIWVFNLAHFCTCFLIISVSWFIWNNGLLNSVITSNYNGNSLIIKKQ